MHPTVPLQALCGLMCASCVADATVLQLQTTKLNMSLRKAQRLQDELMSLRAVHLSATADLETEKKQRLQLEQECALVSAKLEQAQHCEATATAELAQLSSHVAELEVELAALRPPAPPPAPVFTGALHHATLLGDCNTVIAQFAHVPALRDAIQQRDELQTEFDTIKASKAEYKTGVRVVKALNAAKEAVTHQPLSEDDYLTLAARHAALIHTLKAECDDLLENLDIVDASDALDTLATKLEELKTLDASSLLHMQGPPSAPRSPSTSPSKRTAEERDEDWACDPVYVPDSGETNLP
jgi:DNA repair exonuclease SbcCD ATPase subunit